MLAHIKYEPDGTKRTQTLVEHSRHTGAYAAYALKPLGLEHLGMLAGLLHDAGKGRQAWVNYLIINTAWDAYDKGYIDKKPSQKRIKKGAVIHTFAGCIYALEHWHVKEPLDTGEKFWKEMACEILACGIGMHHGLFDCASPEEKNGFTHRLKADKKALEYEQSVLTLENEIMSPAELNNLFEKSVTEIRNIGEPLLNEASTDARFKDVDTSYFFTEFSFVVRMVASAVMYADRRDTAEFESKADYSDIDGEWEKAISFFESKYAQMTADSPINKVRGEMSMQCLKAAGCKDGTWLLDMPTGGGKTLSSLRFALHHAQKTGKKKIIFVIPLLSILDQNAKDIRSYLPPDETVLEHHSDVVMEGKSEGELDAYDTMKDRWSAPVIITTLVQILENLFSSKTSAIARMRALSDAVIVFDEVQTVPLKMTALFSAAMNFLTKVCNSTVILSSATQPTFEKTTYPMIISQPSIVSLTEAQRKPFDRQRYHFLDETDPKSVMTAEQIAEKALAMINGKEPMMIVCNTKSEAARIYDLMKEDSSLTVVYLSAAMCKKHRITVIEEIKDQLKQIQDGLNKPYCLVTTQLVEAGVNLSFRRVIRIMAGDDNLIQSAGRCNRSNEYGSGDVYLCRLQGEEKSLRNLPDIQRAKDAMEIAIANEYAEGTAFMPDKAEFVSVYYKGLLTKLASKDDDMYPINVSGSFTGTIGEGLGNKADCTKEDEGYIFHVPFKALAEAFRVFNDDTYTVLVPYQEGEELINEIVSKSNAGNLVKPELLRKAVNYSIQIYQWQKDKLESNGMLNRTKDGRFLFLDKYAYDDVCGLVIDAHMTSDDFFC